jgi:hypothetical protein
MRVPGNRVPRLPQPDRNPFSRRSLDLRSSVVHSLLDVSDERIA